MTADTFETKGQPSEAQIAGAHAIGFLSTRDIPVGIDSAILEIIKSSPDLELATLRGVNQGLALRIQEKAVKK